MYYLMLTLYFICFGLMAYTVASIIWPYRSTLTEQIGFYEKSWHSAHSNLKETQADLDGAGIIFKLKARLVRRLDLLGPVDFLKENLDRSGLNIQWAEFSFYHLIGAVLGGVFAMLIWGWVAGVVVVTLGSWSPVLVLKILTGKRQGKFADQLPDTLTMLAGSLKAGYSLPQAVDMVSKETSPPMSDEFKRVLSDTRLGLPVEEAFEKMSARLGNINFEWMVLAVKIQREVGGNLVEVLSTLAATIRERETVARQIKVLTAEGRLSALILFFLPFFVGFSLYFVNPEYMGQLFDSSAGISMMFIGAVLMGVGALWLRRIVKIEV